MGETSTYAQITEDHNQPIEEEINTDELNQPLRGCKCSGCGQYLPESWQPPADQPWTTGIFGCLEDPENCWMGLFCPCILFARNLARIQERNSMLDSWIDCAAHAVVVEGGLALAAATAAGCISPVDMPLVIEGLLFSWILFGTVGSTCRISLQRKYHLKDSPCHPAMVHFCCLHWCAMCQEHREMNRRIDCSSVETAPTTTVDPPSMQEMNANGERGTPSMQEMDMIG